MKLYGNPLSPFARKACVIAHALGLTLEEIDILPLKDEGFRKVNPLGKIPALALDDGTIMIDSRVICEYLDHLGGTKFFPHDSSRWKALTLQSLGDGVGEAAVTYSILGREDPAPAHARTRQMAAMLAGMDALEHTEFSDPPLIGEIAVGCALGYIDFRQPELDWRRSRPRLTAWYAQFCEHPSMKATAAKPR
ncbi:MAG: glutathione S-transferase N-terminal domain-containing protein [Rhizomicrobium sp.]